MKKLVVPFMCLLLITGGGCGGKRPKNPDDKGTRNLQTKPEKVVFEQVNIYKAPESLQAQVEKNKTKEAALLLEEHGKYWVFLARGLKPTGGYAVKAVDMQIEGLSDGTSKLTVHYKYTDPAPNRFVTQVLTYPTELTLVKGLQRKPEHVEFVRTK